MSKNKRGISIVVISGSIRPGNFTNKALGIVIDEIKRHEDIKLEVIDPVNFKLPLPGEKENASTKRLKELVSEATGIIMATPEYHGSFSSVIKLIVENLGYPSVLAGKPISLLGVASGEIGAIKAIEHLSSVLSHIGGIVLPGPVSIALVHTVFDKEGRCLKESMEKRLHGLANNHIKYIRNHSCPKMALEELVRGK